MPGAADVRLAQVPDAPDVRVNVDRTLASEVGVTQQQVANDLLVSLSGTAQLAPNFWINPQDRHRIQRAGSDPAIQDGYDVRAGQHPRRAAGCWIQTTSLVQRTQLLGNLADIQPGRSPSNITHYQVRPTFDILAGVRHTDLGSVATGVERIIADARKSLPRGSNITLRGQVQSMRDSFRDMGIRAHLRHRPCLSADGD